MVRALIRDGILRKHSVSGGANGFLFPVPKASMIVHLVRFNKQHRYKPHSFLLPSIEDLSFLIHIHNMGLQTLSWGRGFKDYFFDPFLVALDQQRLTADSNEPLWPATWISQMLSGRCACMTI